MNVSMSDDDDIQVDDNKFAWKREWSEIFVLSISPRNEDEYRSVCVAF